MTPEEQAALDWYGGMAFETVLPCPVCGVGVPFLSEWALRHKQWHEQRGEVPTG